LTYESSKNLEFFTSQVQNNRFETKNYLPKIVPFRERQISADYKNIFWEACMTPTSNAFFRWGFGESILRKSSKSPVFALKYGISAQKVYRVLVSPQKNDT
jgi:hypothetical protein